MHFRIKFLLFNDFPSFIKPLKARIILCTTTFNTQEFYILLTHSAYVLFLVEAESVYCSVRTENLNIVQLKYYI